MKKLTALLLALLMLLPLGACGKSEMAKATDSMIKAIGTVALESEEAIVLAEKMYEMLTVEEKSGS